MKLLGNCNKLQRLLTYNKVCLNINMAEIAVLSQGISNDQSNKTKIMG